MMSDAKPQPKPKSDNKPVPEPAKITDTIPNIKISEKSETYKTNDQNLNLKSRTPKKSRTSSLKHPTPAPKLKTTLKPKKIKKIEKI